MQAIRPGLPKIKNTSILGASLRLRKPMQLTSKLRESFLANGVLSHE
jgi:hypothetical protein